MLDGLNHKKQAAILALLGPTVVLSAYAEVYMSNEQAVAAIFPQAKMEKTTLTLTESEAAQIHDRSKAEVRSKSVLLWKDKSGNAVYVDQVLGKHEFITFAVGFSRDGKVKGVEIIEYRESYGQQVREPAWRTQFVGKDVKSELAVGHDIKNISGATLSSVHVTNGVKRLIVTHDIIKNRL